MLPTLNLGSPRGSSTVMQLDYRTEPCKQPKSLICMLD